MSSIRSASSSTSTLTPSSLTARRSIRSKRRPGVATRMCGLARLVDLAADRRAAVDGRDVEPLRRGERRDVRRDLQRELARRDEDERAGERVPRGGALDERQPEGERLAGAGRRLGQDVESGERVREDEVLDGEGLGDPLLGEHIGDRRADAELLKGLWHCSTPCLWFVRDATSSNNPRKRRNEEPDLHEAGWHSCPHGSSGPTGGGTIRGISGRKRSRSPSGPSLAAAT